MKIVVMKFGGTSVANVEKIKNVAQIVKNQTKNNKVVVVLSAMAGVTNHLQSLIDEVNFSKTNNALPSKESDLELFGSF